MENYLSSAAPLETSAVDEEDIIYETDRWVFIDWLRSGLEKTRFFF